MLSVEKDIGAHLQQARESMGLSLDQLQEKTKIQKSFIVAIENGEFHKLPSPFYVRTYLRTYCKCVKLEPHHILRQYRKAEQAERGLTSVHQAITPEMLAQAQQMYQNNVGMQNTGHNLNMNTQMLHNRAPQTRVSRTQAHTALTIANTNPKNMQQTMQHTGIPRQESFPKNVQQKSISRQETLPKNVQQTSVSRQETIRQITNPVLEQKQKQLEHQKQQRTRSTLEYTRRNEKDQFNKKTTDTQFLEATQLTPRRSAKNTPSTQFATGLTRRANKEATNPPILERSQLSSVSDKKQIGAEVQKQEITRMRQLSRSAVRSNRRSERKVQFGNKKSILIIIASVAICIPLVWATVAALAGDDEKKQEAGTQTNSTEQQQTVVTPDTETNSTDTEQSTEEQIVLTNSSPQENTYEVSGSDDIQIQFQANGQSWIQIRNQRAIQKQGYLSDSTLQSGDRDDYKHSFANGKDIWISIGIPDVVNVTVNGKSIKPAKIIHIKKK